MKTKHAPATCKSQTRKPPFNALFRCACGGYVVLNRSASYMRGLRADSCDSCNKVQ